MATPVADPVLKIERSAPGAAIDPATVDAGLLQRMREYGYVNERNVRASSLERLKHARRTEGLVPFLGAGVSNASGIPAWRALLDALLANVATFPTAPLPGERMPSASLVLQTLGGLPMTSQFDLIVHDCKGAGDEKQREFVGRLRAGLYGGAKFARIRELLEAIPEDNQAKPRHDWTALQRALAENTTLAAIGDLIVHRLTATGSGVPAVQAVLTTNVDNLLQCYVMSRLGGQRRLDTVSDPSSAQWPGNVPVYHLHGWLTMRVQRQGGAVREPPLVFKESEYFSTIASPHSFANNTAQHYFQRSRVLFIGTSLEDLNLRRWLFNAFQERMSAHRSRLECRFPTYATAASEAYAASIRHFWFRRASELPEPRRTMQDFLEDTMRQLGVEVIWYDDHAQIAAWLHDLAGMGIES